MMEDVAQMVEQVDTTDLKSVELQLVWVRVPFQVLGMICFDRCYFYVLLNTTTCESRSIFIIAISVFFSYFSILVTITACESRNGFSSFSLYR